MLTLRIVDRTGIVASQTVVRSDIPWVETSGMLNIPHPLSFPPTTLWPPLPPLYPSQDTPWKR